VEMHDLVHFPAHADTCYRLRRSDLGLRPLSSRQHALGLENKSEGEVTRGSYFSLAEEISRVKLSPAQTRACWELTHRLYQELFVLLL